MRSLRVTCAGLALIAVCSVGAAGLTGCSPAQAGGTARGQVSAVASSSSADSASDEAAQSGEATRDEVVAESVQASPEIASAADAPVADDASSSSTDALAAGSDDGSISTEASMAEGSTDTLPEADGWAPDPVWLSGEGDDARSWSGLVDVSSQSAGSSRAASSQERQYRDGTYYASGTGKFGSVPVTVVISGGRITSIEVGPNEESSVMAERAQSQVIPAIIEAQSADVEVVTGATMTSEAIIDAVNQALERASE